MGKNLSVAFCLIGIVAVIIMCAITVLYIAGVMSGKAWGEWMIPSLFAMVTFFFLAAFISTESKDKPKQH